MHRFPLKKTQFTYITISKTIHLSSRASCAHSDLLLWLWYHNCNTLNPQFLIILA